MRAYNNQYRPHDARRRKKRSFPVKCGIAFLRLMCYNKDIETINRGESDAYHLQPEI